MNGFSGGMKLDFLIIGILLAAIAIGGPIMGVLCGVAGIGYIFYLCFKWGPKLSLIAIPVTICFFLCMWLDDFVLMYVKHMLIFVLICLVAAIAFCHYYYEEGYKGIVIAVTAGATALTMALLASWMYIPRGLSVPDRAAKIQIQQMSESIQVIYADPEDFEELIEKLERVDMCGTFEELVDSDGSRKTYRLTFLNSKGKDIGTYYFFNKHYMAKQVFGDHMIYYRWTEDSYFPYTYLVNMYESVANN